MRNIFLSFIDDEDGATAIEYALIASLVSIFIIGALLLVNDSIAQMFDYISSAITNALT
jgi:pilus assembly protein Flp/PilA